MKNAADTIMSMVTLHFLAAEKNGLFIVKSLINNGFERSKVLLF